ncbi:MAG: hypothetical protein WBE88_06475, partial [Candidatus Acidiferrales bacterium]
MTGTIEDNGKNPHPRSATMETRKCQGNGKVVGVRLSSAAVGAVAIGYMGALGAFFEALIETDGGAVEIEGFAE